VDVGRADPLEGAALVAALAVIAVVGVLVGVCAAWASRAVWRVGGLSLPWGLAVSLIGSMSFVVLARQAGRASAALVAAVSWFAGVVALLVRGDTVVAGDGLGIAFLLVCTGGVMAAATVGAGSDLRRARQR
jgi:hypothetical protein